MILIVDFGGQTAHLIGRRLRQLGVVCEYVDPEVILDEVKKHRPSGIIFSGGPAGVYESGAPTIDAKVFELGLPVLGICYGWQLMAHLLKGKVESAHKEYGPEQLVVEKPFVENTENLFPKGVDGCRVWMSHGDSVVELPKGFEVVGSTEKVRFAAVQDLSRSYFGVQFHPEVDHTEHGLEILKHFVSESCGEELRPLELDPADVVAKVKKKVGKQKVICAVSGGVDSTVAAFLIGKAIGNNLIPVYVKSGLMRPGTEELVRETFTELVEADLVVVDARVRFMKALKGLIDPEKKRKIIGKLYVDIFQEEASKHKDVGFLGQGTIYSDVIESKGSKKASKIKSHHNVGGLPKDMKLKLLEPMRGFYKDEVRELGRKAGLSEELVMQQPFPGPGYAVRIRGEVTGERLEKVKIADLIVVEEMKSVG